MSESSQVNDPFDFIGQRPFIGNIKNEVNEAFKCLHELFSKTWLDEDGENPIQILWKRKNEASTNELYSLGYCCQLLSKIDIGWLTKQINLIKGSDKNNQMGAIFEIIALGYLAKNHNVMPACQNNPGYDANVFFENTDNSIRLSLKYYSYSTHFNKFKRQAEEIERLYKSELQNIHSYALQFLADFHDGCPADKNWRHLARHIPNIVNSLSKGPVISKNIGGWKIILTPLSPDSYEFQSSSKSYTFIAASQFHNNEKKNLSDKIDEACYNLSENSLQETEKCKNLLLIHIPPYAPISTCCNWAIEHLKLFNKNISGVIFYQPILTEDSHSINHNFLPAFKENFIGWINSRNGIHIEVPYGMPQPTTPFIQQFFMNGYLIGSMDTKYIYKNGHHYIQLAKPKIDSNSTKYDLPPKKEFGIKHHWILTDSHITGGSLNISPRHPLGDELLIL